MCVTSWSLRKIQLYCSIFTQGKFLRLDKCLKEMLEPPITTIFAIQGGTHKDEKLWQLFYLLLTSTYWL